MKKVVIIGSRESGTKNSPSIIATHLRERGVDVTLCFWESLVFDIRTSKVTISFNGKDLATDLKPDLVIGLGWYKGGTRAYYRDIAYATALYLERAGIQLWNGEMARQRSTTKLSCMVQLALHDLPVPNTLFSLDRSQLVLPEPPYIAKAFSASRGQDNFLIKTQHQATEVFNTAHNPYLIQPFLPNDHDLRVICFGGEPSLVLRRSRKKSSDTHLNNTSQGGEAQWLDVASIDEKLLTLSRKICIIMGREMGGIDFIPDTTSPSGYSCLEVNAIPQLTSGHDVSKKLDMLARVILQKEGGTLI